jgi:hypothetical protein
MSTSKTQKIGIGSKFTKNPLEDDLIDDEAHIDDPDHFRNVKANLVQTDIATFLSNIRTALTRGTVAHVDIHDFLYKGIAKDVKGKPSGYAGLAYYKICDEHDKSVTEDADIQPDPGFPTNETILHNDKLNVDEPERMAESLNNAVLLNRPYKLINESYKYAVYVEINNNIHKVKTGGKNSTAEKVGTRWIIK